jgi:hypothetical protein
MFMHSQLSRANGTKGISGLYPETSHLPLLHRVLALCLDDREDGGSRERRPEPVVDESIFEMIPKGEDANLSLSCYSDQEWQNHMLEIHFGM